MRVLAVLFVGACASAHLVEKQPVEIAAPEVEDKPAAAPTKPERVQVKDDRIDVSETIQFDYSSSRISDDSHTLLDEIADAIKHHPEIRKLRVEGHTDNQGAASMNLRLSKKRAAAVVKYLVGRGVEGARLVAAGFGQTKPIAKNDTDENRALNRRVAFVILDKGGTKKKVEEAPDQGVDEGTDE